MLTANSPSLRLLASSTLGLSYGVGLALWLVDLGQRRSSKLDGRILDSSEQQRAQQLADPIDRERYETSHILLRHVLSEHLGLPPQSIAYGRDHCERCGGPNGRPVVLGTSGVHFSLSRSHDLILIAIASRQVGVDVERLPQFSPGLTTAIDQMHPEEQEELARVDEPDQLRAFTRLWARKEAYLKAIGTGIAHGIAEPYLGAGDRASPPPGWMLIDIAPAANCLAAVALRADVPIPARPISRLLRALTNPS